MLFSPALQDPITRISKDHFTKQFHKHTGDGAGDALQQGPAEKLMADDQREQ